MATLLVLSASCTTTSPMEDVDTLPGDECAVLTEVVDGFEVTIVGPARPPPPVQPQPVLTLVANHKEKSKLIPLSPRLRDTVHTLMQDRFLGNFVRAMAMDPGASYYLWDGKVDRNGGGVTKHCREDRFDIWLDISYHISQEGTACTNPKGSGSLRSLLAHELGHAWIWRWFNEIAYCDNKARTNMTAVAWENTQLTGGAQRLLHDPPGCGCAK